MTIRLRPHQIAQEGAADGQALVYDAATDAWVPSVGAPVADSLFDAKGDVLAASAADTPTRLPVGSDAAVLTADAAATLGVAWHGNVSVLIENGAAAPPAGTPIGAIIFEKG